MIPVGSIQSPFTHESLLELAMADLEDQTLPRKVRGVGNIFVTPSKRLRSFIADTLDQFDWYGGHQWEIELLVSREPVGVHNDRNRYRHGDVGKVCDYGLIIPLKWDCTQPYTITYDRSYPEKVIYKKSILQTLDGTAVNLINDASMLIDDVDFDRYFKRLTKWTPQLKGLNIHSVHEWKTDEIIIFESERLHSSSEFVDGEGSYKMSLNGLRYRDEDPK